MAPVTDHDEGSTRVVISGLNRTAFDLAVLRFAGVVTHPPRKTRFRLLAPALPDGIGYPQGSI